MSLTTVTTGPIYLDDGRLHRPITRLHRCTSLTTGTGENQNSPVYDTHRYAVVRMTATAHSLNTGTTLTVTCQTGPTTALGQLVASASGSTTGRVINSTALTADVFVGLDRYTQILVATSTANGHGSTDTRLLLEFL